MNKVCTAATFEQRIRPFDSVVNNGELGAIISVPGVHGYCNGMRLPWQRRKISYNVADAVEVATAMHRAMGGMDAWNAAHFVRFDFKVSIGGESKADRSHLWDKQTGRYRLDQKNRVVLMNLANKQGTVYVDGKKLEGPDAAKAIEQAQTLGSIKTH